MRFPPLAFDGSKETPSEKLARQLALQRAVFTALMAAFLFVTVAGLL